MIEVKNQFANHLIFWVLALPLVALLTLPAMMESDKFIITQSEVSFFKDVLQKDTTSITVSADDTFNSLFIKTMIAPSVREFLTPRRTDQLSGVKMVSIASKVSSNYNTALWLMVYRGIWRITGLWTTVLTILFALGLPCLVDGLATRATKSYNFRFHNPVLFWSSLHSMILILGLGVFLPFLPYALNPSIMTSFLVVFCASLWVTAANFQTGN